MAVVESPSAFYFLFFIAFLLVNADAPYTKMTKNIIKLIAILVFVNKCNAVKYLFIYFAMVAPNNMLLAFFSYSLSHLT